MRKGSSGWAPFFVAFLSLPFPYLLIFMDTANFQVAFGDYDNSPEHYFLSEADPLRSAIQLALKLGKPLLITGEPGTGKTQLAYWAAWHLSQQRSGQLLPFLPRPFVFHTKTNT